MKDIKVASRYAQSLLNVALEQNLLETVYSDMQLIINTCFNSRELILLLKSPIIKRDKKASILSEIFNNYISETSHLFIKLILKKHREKLLMDIAETYTNLYRSYKNITRVNITSAEELSIKHQNIIVKQLNTIGLTNIELNNIIDPDIIGGLIIKFGDKQIDYSIKRILKNIELQWNKN